MPYDPNNLTNVQNTAPFINYQGTYNPQALSFAVPGSYQQSGGAYTQPATPPNLAGLQSILNFGNPLSSSGGAGQTVGNIINPLNALIPGIGLFANLFGGGGHAAQPQWRPYYDPKTGQYYWTNPASANPTPPPTVPGAPVSPTSAYKQSAESAQAATDLLPYFSQAINSTVLPSSLAQLQASQATSPGYADLMTQLFNTYGPQLNAIGNQIQRQNALAQATTENQVLTGPGQNLVNNAYNLAQVFDKPYYDTRQLGANNLAALMGSIDLSGGLSNNERNEIQQGLSRNNLAAGTLNAPSQLNTISNAMQYGQAGYQRQQQAKSNLSQALSNASAFLPNAKSGVDVFQVATGRSSMPNPGQSLFPGINSGSGTQSQYGLAGDILGGSNAFQQQQNAQQFQQQFNNFSNTFQRSLGGSLGQLPSQIIGGGGGALAGLI